MEVVNGDIWDNGVIYVLYMDPEIHDKVVDGISTGDVVWQFKGSRVEVGDI